jgi:superfamily II DNA/RNA helicase
MLDMGFIPDIEKICAKLPASRQTLLFSATFPADIQRLAKTFQKDPKKIEVARPAQTAETITQYVVKLPTNDGKARRTALRRVIEACNVKNGIVFCNRKVEVDIVAASLSKHGHDAAPIHGDLPQSVRTETLQRFRDGSLKLLVASDVAARGLDIPDVGHVFNFGPPPKDEDYVHRIGRTGRAGRSGESFTLVSPADEKSWGFVLKMIKKDVAEFMPDGLLDELKDLPPEEKRDRDGRRGGRDRDRGPRGRGERSERGDRGPRRRERSEDAPAAVEAVAVEAVSDVAVIAEAPAEAAPVARDEAPKRERGLRGEKRRERGDKPRGERSEQPRMERTERTDRMSDKRERPQRDYKRKDDDLILEPAPERVKGFGSDIPGFLKKR